MTGSPIKSHRWVVTFALPAKVQRNEDGDFYLNAKGMDYAGEWPRSIWCFDCERSIEDDIWGQHCLAEKDPILTDERWNGL